MAAAWASARTTPEKKGKKSFFLFFLTDSERSDGKGMLAVIKGDGARGKKRKEYVSFSHIVFTVHKQELDEPSVTFYFMCTHV